MKKLILCLLFSPPLWLNAQVQATAPDLSYAASKAIPAVVRIQAFLSDSLLIVHPNLVNIMNMKPVKAGSGMLAGSASGVLLSADGYVITNNHVLSGSDSLVVILQDRRAYHAILTGADERTDLALLKIPGNALPFLELGDPEMVRIGDPVLAVGNPLDLTSTVTAGILSARFRGMNSSLNATEVNSYLQTDAASNEGMSGSALVDGTGKLIGVNSAIISPNGAFAGYSFAIPAGIVRKVWDDLIKYHSVQHAYLNIYFSDMDAAQAKRLNAENVSGVLVDSVQQKGAGERAGLHKDDIILHMDREKINSSPQLRELLAQRAPGDEVALTIDRSGTQIFLRAVLSQGMGNQLATVKHSMPQSPNVIRTNHLH